MAYNRREHMSDEGFFDGRFAERKIPVQTKKIEKQACKGNWKNFYEKHYGEFEDENPYSEDAEGIIPTNEDDIIDEFYYTHPDLIK